MGQPVPKQPCLSDSELEEMRKQWEARYTGVGYTPPRPPPPPPHEPRWIEIDDDEWKESTPAERRKILEDAWIKTKDKTSYTWQIIIAITIAALLVAFL